MMQIRLILNNNRNTSYNAFDYYYYYYRNLVNNNTYKVKQIRPVVLKKDGKIVKEFESITVAAKYVYNELKLTKSYLSAKNNIGEVCRGFKNHCWGLEFSYKMNLTPLLFINKEHNICETNYPDISRKRFTDILGRLNRDISRLVIEDSFEFKIPFGMGSFRMEKYKPGKIRDGKFIKKYLPIDYIKTKQLNQKYPGINKVVYFENLNSDGYIYIWKWFIVTRCFKNRDCFVFKKTDELKKMIHSIVIKESFKENYYEQQENKFPEKTTKILPKQTEILT